MSGGSDSVALLHTLCALTSDFSFKLGVVHLNHCLRQKDSDNDAEFVAHLAKQLGVSCYIGKENTLKYKRENKLCVEEAARHLRYKFYYKTALQNGFSKIALAHHLDDNAELILMNLLRGSGNKGISGMSFVSPVQNKHIQIVRPFINLRKSQILEFLQTKKIKYVSDISNKDVKYFRNRIRHHLIPYLKKFYNPKVVETLNRLSLITKAEEDWIEKSIDSVFAGFVLETQQNQMSLSILKISEAHIAVQRRIIRKTIEKVKGNLRRIAFLHINCILDLSKSKSNFASLDLPDRIRIKKNGNILIVSKEKNALRTNIPQAKSAQKPLFNYQILKPELISINEINAYLKFSEISVKSVSNIYGMNSQIAFFDMDKLSFPLTIRNMQNGDRFHPLGMNGSQKVKKYFDSQKICGTKRAEIPILLCQNKIIWVVGFRMDNSVKIKSTTKNVLKAELLLA